MLIQGFVGRPRRAGTHTFDRLIDTMLSDMGRSAGRVIEGQAFPAVNMWEDDQAVYVEAELPGFSRDQIELNVLGNQLTLSGSREAQPSEQTAYLRRERRMGRFGRTVTLPAEINADKVAASLEHGVLRITLPKSDAAQPRRIEVR